MNLKKIQAVILVLLVGGVAVAQTSTSFKLEEYTFNSGGTPSQGTMPTSASFRVTLASIGDTVSPVTASGSSFSVDPGFNSAYAPPGEVTGLLMTDPNTLVWNPELSVGSYNLYRGDNSDGYGDCEEQNLVATTTTDSSTPTSGSAYYYLVTASNRLAEEGTKGLRSDMATERLGSTCP